VSCQRAGWGLAGQRALLDHLVRSPLGALFGYRSEDTLKIICTTYLLGLKRHAQRPRGDLHLFPNDDVARVGPIPEDRYPRDPRKGLLEQRQAFRD
jgi:hypothetical protein